MESDEEREAYCKEIGAQSALPKIIVAMRQKLDLISFSLVVQMKLENGPSENGTLLHKPLVLFIQIWKEHLYWHKLLNTMI